MATTETRPDAARSNGGSLASDRPRILKDPTNRLAETYAEIERLGLGPSVLELDQKGYTIVPPELVGPPGYHEPLLAAALALAERESGVKPDMETGATHSDIPEARRRKAGNAGVPFQEQHLNPIFKDRAFEDFLLNEPTLALVTYLLGEHAQLSSNVLYIKGPIDAPPDYIPSSVHSDHYAMPAPFPPYAQMCNATIALTDYTREGGCLGFIPGSHRLQRPPLSSDEALDRWEPAEAPAGSLILWHGGTWHTAGNPRLIPGLRVAYTTVFCRSYVVPLILYRDWVPDEMLDRHPPRFAQLMGMNNPFPRNEDPFSDGSDRAGKPTRQDNFVIPQSQWE